MELYVICNVWKDFYGTEEHYITFHSNLQSSIKNNVTFH